jgi:gliding motility-associated-like protein
MTADASCQAVVHWTAPSIVDDCGGSITSNNASGSVFTIGTTLVTYTASDGSGNKATCSFQVTVENEKPPVVLNCPNDILLEADEFGVATAFWDEPTATTACGELIITGSHSPGQPFSTGTTKITYTAADELAHESVCTFNVIVAPVKIDIVVGKLITPDNNNTNDYLEIVNIERFKDNTLVIVDRWGGMIFKADGYDNKKVCWKGNNLNGVSVPTGTYFYTLSIRYGSEQTQKTGFIELIR